MVGGMVGRRDGGKGDDERNSGREEERKRQIYWKLRVNETRERTFVLSLYLLLPAMIVFMQPIFIPSGHVCANSCHVTIYTNIIYTPKHIGPKTID